MKLNDRLLTFLNELKLEIIDPQDIQEDDSITDEEKKEIFNRFIEWSELSIEIADQDLEKEIKEIRRSKDILEPTGKMFTWGSIKADEVFSPIQDHSFIFLAGVQASGKTAYSFDLACKNALIGNRVLYISLEMAAADILNRICVSYAGITKKQWRDKSLIEESQKVTYKTKLKELKDIKNLELFGFDTGEEKTTERIIEIIKAKNPDLIYIDNFDLIDRPQRLNELESQRHISKLFMEFCKDEKKPITMIHHISKSKDKGSVDSMRGSGKLSDDATGIFFCSRNTNPEETDDIERAKFLVYEMKDRQFGNGGFHTFYFKSGTFIDDIDSLYNNLKF